MRIMVFLMESLQPSSILEVSAGVPELESNNQGIVLGLTLLDIERGSGVSMNECRMRFSVT